MKLAELKGKKQLKVIGKLMALAEKLDGDEAFDAFTDGIKGDKRERALFKLGPILERDDVADDIVGIVAYANGVPKEQAEDMDMLAEIMELLTSDVELPAFLSERQ